jgi:hypothetical protein
MMKVVRTIGRWLRDVVRDVMSASGGPPASASGERLRQESEVKRIR